jgi:hypothetical protein
MFASPCLRVSVVKKHLCLLSFSFPKESYVP